MLSKISHYSQVVEPTDLGVVAVLFTTAVRIQQYIDDVHDNVIVTARRKVLTV